MESILFLVVVSLHKRHVSIPVRGRGNGKSAQDSEGMEPPSFHPR
ncbi:hypothetical protein [Nostoc sp.]